MKKLTFILITLTMLLVIPSLVVFAAEPANPLVEDNNINSYSIVYSENGKVSFQNHGKGIDQDSVFELASNGKVIAAYVALSLVNEGMLDLDDKIVQYLSPTFLPGDDRLKDVTVRHLLSHTAGFSPSFELGVDKKIYSEPGSEFRYSGVGYIYLQDIIENVSDMTMEQSAKHYVFEPLKMGNTTFEAAKTVTPYMALSSAVLYAMPIFLIVFIIAIIFVFAIGKLTRFKFFTFKQSFITCLIVGSAANIYFLLFIFLSRVMIIFAFYMLIIGLLLILTRKSKKILYLSSAVFTVLFLILSFVLPVTVPVTNDLVAKKLIVLIR